jgi:two-component system, OmpR family, alkaline phosphatase synthesis response regulator PhoP
MEMARQSRPQGSAYCDAHLVIDFQRRTVTIDSGAVDFTAKEYELLALLVQHAGEIVPRDSLLFTVWGYSDQIRTRTLDVHLARIRKKIGALGHRYIETVFGAGCRFQPMRERGASGVAAESMGHVA